MAGLCKYGTLFRRDAGLVDSANSGNLKETFLGLSEADLLLDIGGLSRDSLASVPFSKQSACDVLTINDLYLMLRKRISKMREKKSSGDFRRDNSVATKGTAKFLRVFLQHLILRIQNLKKYHNASSLEDFQIVARCWKIVKGLILQWGVLADETPSASLSLTTHTRSENGQICLHAHLELLALATFMAEEIEKHFPQFVSELVADIVWTDKSLEEKTSLRSHIVGFAMENVFRFAVVEFNKMQKYNWIQYLSEKPFSCGCFVDLLWLLQPVEERLPSAPPTTLISILTNVLHITQRLGPQTADEFPRSDVVVFSNGQSVGDVSDFLFWTTCQLLTISGNTKKYPKVGVKNLPFEKLFASKILQPVLATLDKQWSESKTRYVVASLRRIQSVTGPQTESLVLLLDFFFRHINDNYSLLTSSVESLQMIQEKPLRWKERWLLPPEEEEGAVCNSNDSSFDLFLRTLISSFEKNNFETWKRVKGRLFSKLHKKFFENLSIFGWSRFFDFVLFLSGKTKDQTDFSLHFCDVALDSALLTTPAVSKTKLLWRGFLAVIAMCRYRNMEYLGLARKLAAEFDVFCRSAKTSRLDVATTNQLWSVALVYLEGWEDLLTDQAESLSLLGTLLTPGLSDLFSTFSDEQKTGKLCTILDDILTFFLQKFPNFQFELTPLTGRHFVFFLRNYFLFVLPSIKKLALQRNVFCTEHISSIAVNCTVIACFFNAEKGNVFDSSVALFQFFVVSEEVTPKVTASFLVQFLQRREVVSQIGREDAMVHSWVRCVIELGEDYHDLQELSREITKLSEISDLNMTNRSGCGQFLEFVERCGAKFDEQTTYDGRMSVQRRCQLYFADIHKYYGNVLRFSASEERVESSVRLIGYILEHCALPLYVRAKLNSTLRQAVDVVIFGAENILVTQSLQTHLPLYLRALCKLDFETDPQVRDLLSAVIRNSLLKFGSTSPLDDHPLLTGLRTANLTHPRSSTFAIAMICNTFLVHISVPYNAALAVAFLVRFLTHLNDDLISQSAEIIFAGGVEAFLRGTERMQADARILINRALTAYTGRPTEKTRNSLASTLREKCLAAMQAHPMSMFLILNSVADQCPILLREILPFIAQVCSGKIPAYPMYQNASARQSYEALQQKMESAGFV